MYHRRAATAAVNKIIFAVEKETGEFLPLSFSFKYSKLVICDVPHHKDSPRSVCLRVKEIMPFFALRYLSLITNIHMSQYSNSSTFTWLNINMAQHPHVLTLLHLNINVSQHPHVSTSICLNIHMSQHSHILTSTLSQYPQVLTSTSFKLHKF